MNSPQNYPSTELDLYWQWATSIPARVKGSYALIGQRRTGKTAILHRLFNRQSFDGRTVDGDAYFTISTPVTLPKIDKLERRGGVVKEGIMNEIDPIGEWRLPADGGTGVWLVSVRHRQQKMGETDVRQFLDHCANVRTEKGYAVVQCWYVSKAGFTRPALTLLQAEGVYASDLAQFNALAQQFGFLGVTV